MGITHATVAAGTDSGTGEIHKAQWNADHTGPGILLASKVYRPGGSTTLSTTSTSSIDADATNLIVTFTAPASGAVFVDFSALARYSTSSSAYWQVRESSSVVDWQRVLDAAFTAFLHVTFHISGLTPGASKTYKWGFSGDGGTVSILVGPGTDNIGPAIMRVTSAP